MDKKIILIVVSLIILWIIVGVWRKSVYSPDYYSEFNQHVDSNSVKVTMSTQAQDTGIAVKLEFLNLTDKPIYIDDDQINYGRFFKIETESGQPVNYIGIMIKNIEAPKWPKDYIKLKPDRPYVVKGVITKEHFAFPAGEQTYVISFSELIDAGSKLVEIKSNPTYIRVQMQ